ncbi:MAG: ABC transporter ATP-binding protein [Alphaproteobacteria bacterium]|nr:ABC transporter ATP-binding protein [Alphaproteobacteria bacterium]
MNNPVLELKKITKIFSQGGRQLPVLQGANLTIEAGQMVALLGPSGSGKSTLLQIAGLLEKPSGGEVWLNSARIAHDDDTTRTRLRRDMIGFVYQYHHLLPEFSALENIMLPQLMVKISPRVARVRARELLRAVGLAERADHRPGQLSGGEQQRVAIARALANSPKLLIADEPTGNLDPATADHVFEVLTQLVAESGLAVLMATHNHILAQKMPRAVTLSGGQLVA